MAQVFEDILQQIHEIRNLIDPFDQRLANLEAQIAANRKSFLERTAALEIRVMASTYRLDEQTGRVEDILENYSQLLGRVKRLEAAITLCQKPEKT